MATKPNQPAGSILGIIKKSGQKFYVAKRGDEYWLYNGDGTWQEIDTPRRQWRKL